MLGLTVKGPIVNEGTSETDDQRAVRLAQLSHNQQQRLSTESDNQRAARLAHLNHNQRQRLSTENDDQRAARLAQLSHNRQERMSLETPEVRQRRLQLDRDGHQQTRQLRTQSQKIEKYHADLANLSSSSVCLFFRQFLLATSLLLYREPKLYFISNFRYIKIVKFQFPLQVTTGHDLFTSISHATKCVCSNGHAYKLVKARPHNVSTFF